MKNLKVKIDYQLVKTLLFLLVSIIISNASLMAQGTVFSVGVAQLNLEPHDDAIQFSSLDHQIGSLAFEAVNGKGFAAKLQAHHSLQKTEIRYFDARLAFIYHIKLRANAKGKGARFSFPITLSGMYTNITDSLNETVIGFGFSGQIGFRAYLTQKLALEGHIGKNIYAANQIGDREFEEQLPEFNATQISIGLSYFITKQKN